MEEEEGEENGTLEEEKEDKSTEEEEEYEDESGGKLFCLCRKPYTSDCGFMIACDYCKGWYHPKCIRMSVTKAKELAKSKWKCTKCEGNK